jgi:hypothetical protein
MKPVSYQPLASCEKYFVFSQIKLHGVLVITRSTQTLRCALAHMAHFVCMSVVRGVITSAVPGQSET